MTSQRETVTPKAHRLILALQRRPSGAYRTRTTDAASEVRCTTAEHGRFRIRYVERLCRLITVNQSTMLKPAVFLLFPHDVDTLPDPVKNDILAQIRAYITAQIDDTGRVSGGGRRQY